MPPPSPSIQELKALEYEEIGERLLDNDDFEGALVKFSKAIFLRPKSAQLYSLRGDIYLKMGDIKSALANRFFVARGNTPNQNPRVRTKKSQTQPP